MIINIALLVASMLATGPVPAPAEDDSRHELTWAVARILGEASGLEDGDRIYEWSGPKDDPARTLYVGLVFPDSECSVGQSYNGSWTPVQVTCP